MGPNTYKCFFKKIIIILSYRIESFFSKARVGTERFYYIREVINLSSINL